MTSQFFRRAAPIATACALLMAAGAQAQGMNTTRADNGYMPWNSGGGYIGLNLGRSDYNVSSGAPGLAFDNKGDFGKLTLGSLVNPNLGYEMSYLHNGNIDRAGGRTKAEGLNFSVVGRIPLAQQFSLFGKLGATYGRTRTDALVGSGVQAGKDSGWGLGVGVGAAWDFAPQWSLVAEWERHDYHFAGNKDGVDAASIGVRYRF